jgi:hypothetical protein
LVFIRRQIVCERYHLALQSGTLNVSDVSNVHSSVEFERESTDKPTASAVGS